MLATVAAA